MVFFLSVLRGKGKTLRIRCKTYRDNGKIIKSHRKINRRARLLDFDWGLLYLLHKSNPVVNTVDKIITTIYRILYLKTAIHVIKLHKINACAECVPCNSRDFNVRFVTGKKKRPDNQRMLYAEIPSQLEV